MKTNWLARRYLDLRNGHSYYTTYIIAIINFVIISYALALKEVPVLQMIFPHMWVWGMFFMLTYIPTAIIIGHFYKKKQYPTDTFVLAQHNPILQKQIEMLDDFASALEALARHDGMKIHIARFSERLKQA